MDIEGQWQDLDLLFSRPGNLAAPEFEPDPDTREALKDNIRILCVGAGGLGCELLKDLALSGFGQIDVIDMDTIDVSNLNRQFLFRLRDVGKSKAEVAAERVMSRVAGVTVTPHFCRIEDKPLEFYEDFHVIILGLDSLEARRYMNKVACSFLEFEDDGTPTPGTVKPVIDGGTEGFKGHARVILPGYTPCFDCTLWLFPPQTKFPLCTLAETPRSAPHCIEYAKLLQWQQDRPHEEFDADNDEHMKWIYDNALIRAQQFGISGVTYQLTQGVVKNIIPAIASTNAIVAAACTLEALKTATMFAKGMDNYMMYVGTAGVYTHTVAYERDPTCIMCSSGIPLEVSSSATLQEVVDALLADPKLGPQMSQPSVSCGSTPLYMHGVLEEETRPNLTKGIKQLLDTEDSTVLLVNDKKLSQTLRVRLRFRDDEANGHE